MIRIDTVSSREIVRQMVHALGQPRVAAVLAVTPTRLAAFVAGRGRLTETQMNRIAAHTRKTCRLWALDAGEAAAKTTADRARIVREDGVLREMFERHAADDIAAAEAALAAEAVAPPTLKPTRRSRPVSNVPSVNRMPVRRRRATA